MKAVVMHRTGGPEVLQPDRLAEPVQAAGQSRQDPSSTLRIRKAHDPTPRC
jgi:hypothetical protein